MTCGWAVGRVTHAVGRCVGAMVGTVAVGSTKPKQCDIIHDEQLVISQKKKPKIDIHVIGLNDFFKKITDKIVN